MLCTVSTVKDSRANLEKFIDRNLASGADHMFVFLEEDTDGSYAFLLEQPSVTPVLTDKSYWGADKPAKLTDRQMINANLVNCLLSPCNWVDWLAHIDGDECLDIDKEPLLALGPNIRCVRLGVLEAVSTEESGLSERYFKTKLTREPLMLLTQLGLIAAPDNRHYFFGHLVGKAAVRPSLDLNIGVHRATSRNGKPVRHLKSDFFNILHYDSVSSEEFSRKWEAHLSGGASKFRPERKTMAAAIANVIDEQGMDPAAKKDGLVEIYKRHIEDPVDQLLELGLLVRPPLERHRYLPASLSDPDKKTLDTLLQHLLDVDKSLFRRDGGPHSLVNVMRTVAADLGRSQRGLAEAIDAAIERGISELQPARRRAAG